MQSAPLQSKSLGNAVSESQENSEKWRQPKVLGTEPSKTETKKFVSTNHNHRWIVRGRIVVDGVLRTEFRAYRGQELIEKKLKPLKVPKKELHKARLPWTRGRGPPWSIVQILGMRPFLNKLTPQNVDTLVTQVLALVTEDRAGYIALTITDRAFDDHLYTRTYAKLCEKILLKLSVPKVPPEDRTQTAVKFRNQLLDECQREFKTYTNDSAESRRWKEWSAGMKQARLDAVKNEKERKELQESLDKEDRKTKRRTLGLMRFRGELYNLSFLDFHTMHDSVLKLMKKITNEDSVELVCVLLRIIGKKFAEDAQNSTQVAPDEPSMKDMYNEVMQKLREIIEEKREARKTNKEHLSLKSIFMLEDVLDLDQRNWIPRREVLTPEPLDVLHECDKSKTPNSYGGQPQAAQETDNGEAENLEGILD